MRINIMPITAVKTEYFVILAGVLLFLFMPYAHLMFFLAIGMVFACFLFFAFISKEEDFDFIFTLFVISFLARILISLFTYEFRIFIGIWPFIGDGHPYVYNGNIIADAWSIGVWDYQTVFNYVKSFSGSGTLTSYDFWNGFILFFTDRNPLVLALINSAAGSLTAFFIYQTARDLCNNKSARIAALLAAFWPSTFIWSTQNLKEPITCLLISAFLWAFVKLRKKISIFYLGIIVAAGIALRYFREPFFALLYIAAIPVFFIFYAWLKFLKKSRFITITVTFFIICLLFVIAAKYSNALIIKKFLISVNSMRESRAYGNLAFMQGVDFSSIPALLAFLPAAFLMVLLAPFPWQMISFSQMVSLPEMLAYYVVLFFSCRGILFGFKKEMKEALFMLIFIIIACIFLALFEGNIGTIFRHRAMILPYLFILAGIGMGYCEERGLV